MNTPYFTKAKAELEAQYEEGEIDCEEYEAAKRELKAEMDEVYADYKYQERKDARIHE